MTLDWFRDLVIVILVILAIVATIGFMTMGLVLFFKATSILDSVKSTATTINRTVTTFSNTVVRPAVQVKRFIDGLRRVVGAIDSLTGRKGDEK